MPIQIQPAAERVAELCRRHHIRRLSVVGSVLREDFRPESDIDVLVEFDPERRPGMVGLHQVEEELSNLYGGHRIDLLNPKYLNRRIRDRLLREAEVLFAEG
ncbi:MAG: nucleotidyltransferase domain-containing protein [Acidobacteria bacterium]|nr:nucleotidyltransferase domain-containing protein [Acidobacteriota bacterium]